MINLTMERTTPFVQIASTHIDLYRWPGERDHQGRHGEVGLKCQDVSPAPLLPPRLQGMMLA
jgi:hypothetical protein